MTRANNNEPRENKPFMVLGDGIATVSEQGEASQIYNKGCFGDPQSGGSLTLVPVEAVYLVDIGRVRLKGDKGTMDDIIRWAMRDDPSFEVKYLVFREMRQRGYIVKDAPAPVDFRVFPRGGKPNKSPTKYWMKTTSERWPMVLADVRAMNSKAASVQKTLLVGVADEEGDVTYYVVSDRDPDGDREPDNGVPKDVSGLLMEDRVMVFDPDAAKAFRRPSWYGQMVGVNLQLSLIEAAYLVEKGYLKVKDVQQDKEISFDDLVTRGRDLQEAFDLRLQVYRDMREKGLIVKTGFKYGAHFRAYDGDPENHHARFLVDAVEPGHETTWPRISGAVRLSHGVKKEYVLASPVDDNIVYTRIRRDTP